MDTPHLLFIAFIVLIVRPKQTSAFEERFEVQHGPDNDVYYRKFYTLGSLVPGLILLAKKDRQDHGTGDQDLTTEFEYHSAKNQHTQVKYVQVITDQKSNEGGAYVKDGGLGKNHVTVVVFATNTPYLKTNFTVYGLN